MPTKIEKDIVTGTDTTGHEWDGVKELNTPLPKWWVWTFYVTVIWGIGYCIAYPSLPWFKGLLGYSQRAEIAQRMDAAKAQKGPMMERIRSSSLEDIRKNAQLFEFARAGGRVVFADNCATCHGSGGAGALGYPNLADDDWIWGGDLTAIQETIAYGIRNADDRSRNSQMPKFGVDGVLNAAQIDDVAEYVLSMGNRSGNAQAAGRGKALYAENCVTCHGEKGEGNREVGAPRLADQIWLYGGDKAAIVKSIAQSRAGSMPAWAGRFDEATIKMLAVYVHGLGGGE